MLKNNVDIVIQIIKICRLYETQVKKIVKVQSMMRAFLAKRNVANKLKAFRQESSESNNPLSN